METPKTSSLIFNAPETSLPTFEQSNMNKIRNRIIAPHNVIPLNPLLPSQQFSIHVRIQLNPHAANQF